jgi:hypothetical protein
LFTKRGNGVALAQASGNGVKYVCFVQAGFITKKGAKRMRGNTIKMRLLKGKTNGASDVLFQYDYGQVIQFTGVTLPESYEVHFSNKTTGESLTMIGGANGVEIPDELLQTGMPVYLWVYLHNGEDDGETEYSGLIQVQKRPEPTNEPPTPEQQDAITQAIAALTAAVEQCQSYAAHNPKIVDGYLYVWDENAEDFVNTGVEIPGGDD